MVMIANVKKRVTAKVFKLLPGHRPDFIIVGAQKSGTTSLHYYLDQHPTLCGSNPKEIHFFDRWVNHGNTKQWYERHFRSLSLARKLYFESSPSYIYYEDVPLKLKKYHPEIKLILVLRDPVKRAFSAWNMYYDIYKNNQAQWILFPDGRRPGEPNSIYKNFFLKRKTFPSFREAIQIELDLINSGNFEEPAILRRGLYRNQIENYYRHFRKDQILILGFEDMIKNTEQTLNSICEFLDVEKFNYQALKIEPKNARAYDSSLTEDDQKFLIEYYAKENESLFELIEQKLNW